MGKRRPYPDGEGPRKRPRVVHEAPTCEDILSARQLMQLLAFDQDLQKARHGIQSLKVLLDKLNDPEKHRPEDAAILRSYLESSGQRKDDAGDAEEGESDPLYLPDIMDTWDFAAKVNNDGLMSAVPVVLALLIRYLSHVLDMAPICLGICRTLLRRRQQEMIAHNLSADKGKEFIISPTLRLLREALTFDGGAIAKPLFRARNFTYRSLARNMSLKFLGDGIEDVKRTSVRTNAVRFFLASLKFLHPEAKAELLNQRDTVNALTRTIKEDPPYVVYEILNTLRDHVLKDKKLQRSSRVKLFNAATLIRLSGLYTYAYENAGSVSADGEMSAEQNKMLVSDTVHQLLMHVCTSSAVGVLRDQNGFYPQGIEPNSITGDAISGDSSSDAIRLGYGLESIAWVNKFTESVPVFNLALAEFLSHLRPWSSTRQSELAISIFQAAPELVSWYFIDRKSFTFEPKMSATWVGYAAFLFNAIQVEIPPYFGNKLQYARVPPPTTVLVDNILPRPLTQKILSRCLAQKSKLIPFFAMRLLVIAMEKLQRSLEMHREARHRNGLESFWPDSERRVVDEFCRRCPPMKEIINAYRDIDEDDLLCREAASRVLRLYYEVVPQVALNSKFDVSPYLFAAVRQVDEHSGSQQDKAVKLLGLENLLTIAGYSPGMQWFSKAKGLSASPFAALLKVYTEATGDLATGKIRNVLDFVAQEQQLFLPDLEHDKEVSAGLLGLFDSLKPAPGSDKQSLLSDPVWAFVDNCVVRCATGPIKYIEMMADFGDSESFDPITMTIVEQLRFATEKASAETQKKLIEFLKKYLATCRGDKKGLDKVVERLSSAFPDMFAVADVLKKVLSKRKSSAQKQATANAPKEGTATDGAVSASQAQDATPSPFDERTLEDVLDLAPMREYDTAALSKWTTKSADELVEDGHAAAVIGLLVSSEDSVRRQALVNLTNMAAKIRESAYDEKDQVWLLLSELVESTKAWMTDSETAALPVPSHIVSFACHALDVLRNPLHCLYVKLNTFLTAGPVWRMRTFPLVNDIVHDGPSEDDSYYTEISWMLAYLVDSLRTAADIDYFRSKRLFETIVSVASNPYMRTPLRRQVLRLVARVAEIEGGSTTLITRSGIVSWLTAQQAATATATPKKAAKKQAEGNGLDEYDESAAIQALLKRLWETCDRDRVEGWSMHGVQENIGI